MFFLYCLLASQAWIVAAKVAGNLSLKNGSKIAQEAGCESQPRAKAVDKITLLR